MRRWRNWQHSGRALPVADEARAVWRSGQRMKAFFEKPNRLWEPQVSRGARLTNPQCFYNLIYTRRWRNWQHSGRALPVADEARAVWRSGQRMKAFFEKPNRLWEPQVSRGARLTNPQCFYNLIFMRRWRNWQTRWIQVPVVAILCGFKSHPPHQKKQFFRTAFFIKKTT